jgi:hypothetical protein
MATYHPPKIITTNAAPAITADLAYEVNGKCGCQTVILSGDFTKLWIGTDPAGQPDVGGCVDYSNVYRVVALANTKFRGLRATNIAQEHLDQLVFQNTSFILKTDSEILANFTNIEILSGTLMLYRDCNQS